MASPTPETTSRSVDVPKTPVVDSFSSMSVMELLKQIKEKSLQEGLVVILEEEGHLEDLPESTRLGMVALVSETKLDTYSLKDKSMAEKSGVSSKNQTSSEAAPDFIALLSPSPPSSPPPHQDIIPGGSHSDDIPGSISGWKSLNLTNNRQTIASNGCRSIASNSSSDITTDFHQRAKFGSDSTNQQQECRSYTYITHVRIRPILRYQNYIYISKDDIPVQQTCLSRLKVFMKAKSVVANYNDGYYCIYGPTLEQKAKARRTFVERSRVDTRFVFRSVPYQFGLSLFQGNKHLRSHPFSYDDDSEAYANSYFLDK